MLRRNFLKLAGSAGVIVAAGGVGFAATRTPTAALKPWQEAESLYSDPMRRALSYAILAPNPHNRQPWIVELKGDAEAVLSCDLGRLLPVTDPFSRQIVIGLGCFLELFSIAAAQDGLRADIRYFSDGQPGDQLGSHPVAHLSLHKGQGLPADPLFAYVLERHTNRDPYDTERTISDGVLEHLHHVAADNVRVGTVNGGEKLNDLRVLTRGSSPDRVGRLAYG